ncbi:MAG: gamma-glutamylcyclotransferase [Deltaproteobacteria bacterium]|nr:gamma-glutamylcyclotransferase [Deltaproteobacteria bacterium]
MSLPLFDYGQLSDHCPLAGLIAPLLAHPATVQGRLFRTPSGQPTLLLGGRGEVHGRLLEGLPDRTLPLLDAVLGVHQGTARRVEVRAVHGLRAVSAWTWISVDARPGTLVKDGVWRGPVRR